MSNIVLQLTPQDRNRLPPPGEFPTVMGWLEALPPNTLVLMTEGEGEFRHTLPRSVESLIDAIASAPLYEEALRKMGWFP